MPPFGGGQILVDKSAWAVANKPAVSTEWAKALRAGQFAIAPVTRFEILYSARNGAEYDQIQEELDVLRPVAQNRSVQEAAEAALRELAWRQPRLHRVPLPDALLAAAAQEAGLPVLHYDGDFDRLAKVMSFESRWIAAPGGL
jgi:predicted nucleic acid-binding protein